MNFKYFKTMFVATIDDIPTEQEVFINLDKVVSITKLKYYGKYDCYFFVTDAPGTDGEQDFYAVYPEFFEKVAAGYGIPFQQDSDLPF